MTEHPTIARVCNDGDRGFSAASIVAAGDVATIFLSGEIGRTGPATLVGGGTEAEARQCFANIGHALARAGAGFADVVKLTVYLTDLADYPAYAKVRQETFGEVWPASTCVGVDRLLMGARIEIDAVAAVAKRGG